MAIPFRGPDFRLRNSAKKGKSCQCPITVRRIVGRLHCSATILWVRAFGCKEIISGMATMLDKIDLSILALLQDDGRMSNVELARKVGLTAPPCLRRVKALEQKGIIKSYHAALSGPALGYTITVFAMVSLKSQAERDLKAFEDHVATLPEVREC